MSKRRISDLDETEFIEVITGAMERQLEPIKSSLATVQADVAVLKTDVAVLKTDVGVLKTDVAVLKMDVADLKVALRRQELKTDFLFIFLRDLTNELSQFFDLGFHDKSVRDLSIQLRKLSSDLESRIAAADETLKQASSIMIQFVRDVALYN